jgi:RND family efflux transporter MFP subunit
MRTFFKFILVLLILGSGGLVAKKLIDTKPAAKRKPVSIGAPLVTTLTAVPISEQVEILAMGTVIPAREVVIQPRVSGHVTDMNPELIPGGHIRAGDLLLRIDDQDYVLAVAQRKADVARAVMELKTEESRQAIAKKEWTLLGTDVPATDSERDMALRKPQLENAKAALVSARSLLKKARLDVSRTRITAPFHAFVRDKSVDTGQYVMAGSKLATLVGTDEFWVQISVPFRQVSQIAIPGINATDGASARIIQEAGTSGDPVIRQGRVVRLLGELDPAGRMARLLVSVADPFQLQAPLSESGIPLLLGAYVTVEIEGPWLENVFVIPRKAFRDRDRVWLMTDEKTLAIRSVTVVWRRKADVMVSGLSPGDQVITSRISTPVPGMELRDEETMLSEAPSEPDTPN